MTKKIGSLKLFAAAIIFLGVITTSQAQDEIDEHVMNGTTINWSYTSNGAAMVLSFDDGKAQYEWIAGARKGNSAQDIPYRSREISDDVFLISWDQADRPDFITLIFDFKENLVFSTGLIGYGTENQRNLFLDGTVQSVER